MYKTRGSLVSLLCRCLVLGKPEKRYAAPSSCNRSTSRLQANCKSPKINDTCYYFKDHKPEHTTHCDFSPRASGAWAGLLRRQHACDRWRQRRSCTRKRGMNVGRLSFKSFESFPNVERYPHTLSVTLSIACFQACRWPILEIAMGINPYGSGLQFQMAVAFSSPHTCHMFEGGGGPWLTPDIVHRILMTHPIFTDWVQQVAHSK